jgi:hypothetical protein
MFQVQELGPQAVMAQASKSVHQAQQQDRLQVELHHQPMIGQQKSR